MCVEKVRVFEEDARMVFAKSTLTSGGYDSSLDDYDGALELMKA